jgi:predicted acetyltransferase
MEIRLVDRSEAQVVDNLLELYCHDMAEWFLLEAREDGRYGYPPERVWNDETDVHLAYLGRIPVGFALVGPGERSGGAPGAKDLKEFFVVRRHRGSGLGERLARHVWNRYPGPWLVRVYRGNRPALPFWRAIVARYTDGAFDEEAREDSGREWSFFTFDSATSARGGAG